MRDLSHRLYRLLNSKSFFVVVLALFVFESAWVALSALYPQAFDEQFHFGLIQLYSYHSLPFLSAQPKGANAFGAVARDPSYLYHYLMSFPYRLIRLFVHSQTGQVILLRFINIALFGSSLVLLRRVLLKVGTSRPLANFCILLFILIPIVPQLAAQINYDNLLLPLIAWVVLMTFSVMDQLRSRKLSIVSLCCLFALCLLTSLVKYAFLPIFVAVIVFLAIIAFISYKKSSLEQFFKDLLSSWKRQSRLMQICLVVLLILSMGMFIQRDGVNLIKYHNIAPSCSTVLNVKDCSAYSVWDTDYTRHVSIASELHARTFSYMTPIKYLSEWFYWMWYRSFFAVNGPASGFTNYAPLPLPAIGAAAITVLGIFLSIKWRRKIFKNNPHLIFLLLIILGYCVALILQGYSTYHYTGVLENMNGRYLLPILLFVAAIFGKAISLQLKNATIMKVIISVVVLILFLEGGGIVTFLVRSDDTWYFQNHVVKKINNEATKIVKPVVIKNKRSPISSSVWLE